MIFFFASNFDKGRRGDHKHKIIDRPLSQNKVHFVASTFATGCRCAWYSMYESLQKGFIINRNCNKNKVWYMYIGSNFK